MNKRPDTSEEGPFPKQIFPKEVFPGHLFPWMSSDEEEDKEDGDNSRDEGSEA